jgi:hypothetical protein
MRQQGFGQTCPAVHPHARGEHCIAHRLRQMPVRFIPTHVGNIRLRKSRRVAFPVHPHARGEHVGGGGGGDAGGGSSPRTWGTSQATFRRMMGERFIPTHVGNMAFGLAACSGLAVHPHARGEHLAAKFPCGCTSGSSPRTWGTSFKRRFKLRQARFIPTHVGNMKGRSCW